MIQKLPTVTPLVLIIAILCITVLGVFALVEGLNGGIFVTTIAAIAGLGGYAIKRFQ